MTSTFVGKPPNFPWKGSMSQWDQERSDQIRVGEGIFQGYERMNNWLRGPLFETEQMKKDKQRWRESLKPKVVKKSKLTPEFIDDSKLELADFM